MKKQQQYDSLTLTEHPPWAKQFWADLEPLKERIASHPLFNEMAAGTLDVACFRHALLNFYPLVANFPHYMSLALSRAVDIRQPGILDTRDWLIGNIRIEQRHLYWYRDWAIGFGITATDLDNVKPPAAMDAVNHYLWNMNQRASLAEAIAATNLAIEWATGEWSQKVVHGMRHYAKTGQAVIDRRTMAWLRAHAHYDDMHPHEAMELIKRLCVNDQDRDNALQAAKRGMEYYILALDECFRAHQGNATPHTKKHAEPLSGKTAVTQ
ncbi:MAG: TENA/THI-4 domain protein [Gammaproteobacteria bacterium HGW-Gammaproteobacteria-14]|nr:MAG: TENA/THI-4 domain protein [Gammaproteobacteria bacterium HGW-Gammaproteobacteria-14]